MGTEQGVPSISKVNNTNDPQPKQNRQSTGYNVDTSLHVHVQENITKTLKTYKQNEDKNKLCFIPKENIISDMRKSFNYIKQLGKGASCRVLKAQNISNNKVFAIKELNKKHTRNSSLFCKEVQILKKLHHPNILSYSDCFVDDKYYYIATEYCSGGTLLDKLIKMKYFSEQKASQYIKNILSAVNYMHSLNIAHRDIKAQNIVFDDETLQIIDFGDSKIVNDDQIYNEFVGTIHYLPPEIIRARSGKELKKSDLWSIGVLTYILVCGISPFFGSSLEEILSNIINKKKKKLLYPKGINISESCKNFIQSLLCYDISDRMSAADALKHKWICGSAASTLSLQQSVSFSDDIDWACNCFKDLDVNNFLTQIDSDGKVQTDYGSASRSSINLYNI